LFSTTGRFYLTDTVAKQICAVDFIGQTIKNKYPQVELFCVRTE